MDQLWHALQYMLLSVLVQFQPFVPADEGDQALYQLTIGEEDRGRLEVVVEGADEGKGVSGFVLRSDYVAGDAPPRWLRARFLDYDTLRVVNRVGDATTDFLAEPVTLPPITEAVSVGFDTYSPLRDRRIERGALVAVGGDTLRTNVTVYKYEVARAPQGERLSVAMDSTYGVVEVRVEDSGTHEAPILFRLVPVG